jgi:hypothetical protein
MIEVNGLKNALMRTAYIHHLFILRLKDDIRTFSSRYNKNKTTRKKGNDVIDIKLQNQ